MRTLVVLPTYNEIPNIELMLRTLREVVPYCHVLVVDDGSPDGTAARARAVGAELDGVTVLERSAKGGLGGAYRTGFTWGLEHDFDHFVEIDSDFSHDPRVLPTLLAAAEEYDVVVGSRYVKGGHIPNWARSRRLLSRGGNLYAEIVLNLKVADSTSGYRVYSRPALEKMDYQTVTADGYGFQIEMTYRARSNGVSIIEVPISFKDRELGESKMSKAIVVEALGLVTQWAIQNQVRRLRR
ncbi:MAG: dolichol-phosphate mannosyltransferase [Acidimicrobiaceae bacterium]|nr:dolichol-phosphate mannosyltransferase [Acidimicrobiaceae bacterium]